MSTWTKRLNSGLTRYIIEQAKTIFHFSNPEHQFLRIHIIWSRGSNELLCNTRHETNWKACLHRNTLSPSTFNKHITWTSLQAFTLLRLPNNCTCLHVSCHHCHTLSLVTLCTPTLLSQIQFFYSNSSYAIHFHHHYTFLHVYII